MAFIEFSKAFDKLWRSKILINCNGHRETLRNMHKMHKMSEANFIINIGVCPGECSSPTFFILYIFKLYLSVDELSDNYCLWTSTCLVSGAIS